MPLLPESADFAVGTVDKQIQVLSMEAGLVANVIDSFSKLVPSLQEMIANAFSGLSQNPDDKVLSAAKETESNAIII